MACGTVNGLGGSLKAVAEMPAYQLG